MKGASQTGSAVGGMKFDYDSFYKVISSSVLDGLNNEIDFGKVEFAYDKDGLAIAAGPMTLNRNIKTGFLSETVVGGVTDTRRYTGFGELYEYEAYFNGSLLYSYRLTRDKLGRITNRIENIGGQETFYDYAYDTTGRLTEVKENGVVTGTYTYDSNGARSLTSDHGYSSAATIDAQDRMTKFGDLSLAYSANGDLRSRTDVSISESVTYAYDSQGNLTTASLPGSCSISYVTDGLNRRVAKKYNGSLERQFVFEDQLRVAGMLDKDGELLQRYVYGTTPHSPDLILMANANYRVITDHLGSVRLIVNAATGEIARSMNHDAWGRVTLDSNPRFSPFGFAGGIYDSDTKLVRFGARDYNPETGTWTNKDPIGFKGGDTNLYAYVGNDPVNLIDPTGLEAEIVIWQPVGWSSSSFGHVSANINGTAYSFGPGGMWTGDATAYASKNSFRNGVGIKLNLSTAQESALTKSLEQDQGSYNTLTNNCGDPVERALNAVGVNAGSSLFPVSLGNALISAPQYQGTSAYIKNEH